MNSVATAVVFMVIWLILLTGITIRHEYKFGVTENRLDNVEAAFSKDDGDGKN